MCELRVLGVFDVRATGSDGAPAAVTQPKRLALLLYLALAQPQGLHSRERILALLWPEADDQSSRHSLRNALHDLRRALGDDAIVVRGDAYVGLNFGVVGCDALRLRADLAAGRLEDALIGWTGELVPGFHVTGAPDFAHWLDDQRAQLLRDVRAAAWQRARDLEGTPEALAVTERAVRLDPGDEPGARRLMRLLAAAGDAAGALRVYRALVTHLTRELDAQPSPESQALAAELHIPAESGPALAGSVPHAELSQPPRATLEPQGRFRRSRWAIAAGVVIAIAIAATSDRAASRDVVPESEAERAVLRLPARYRADTSAYRSYLRGLALRFENRFPLSRDTFAALVKREPLYVPGLYGLAHAYALSVTGNLLEPDATWPKVEQLARQALALDSTAASAWIALAGSDLHWRRDVARAGEKIDRARMLDSLDPDVPAMRSIWFRTQGRMDSSIAEARRAAAFDPLSKALARQVARQLYLARRFDEAERLYLRMIQDDPTWTRGYADIGDVYLATGRVRESVEWYRRGRLAAGDSAGAASLAGARSDADAERLLATDASRGSIALRRRWHTFARGTTQWHTLRFATRCARWRGSTPHSWVAARTRFAFPSIRSSIFLREMHAIPHGRLEPDWPRSWDVTA
jgi:DNA-binding SARP family transcriptional activator